jgi:thiamine biosynthesis lipoprotein
MDTVISIEVVGERPDGPARAAIRRALRWFEEVERACSRFDPESELRQLTGRAGEPVVVSSIVFEAVRFALALAQRTRGAFDPTIGEVLEAHGFDRNYRTGERIGPPPSTSTAAATPGMPPARPPVRRSVTHRDIRLDPARQTITLRRPLVLDLGAVAKGLAIDLAARELSAFTSFCVDAGGDLVARGRNASGLPWRVGIQHPGNGDVLAYALDVSDEAVCTSGDYERVTADGLQHHLIDPRTGQSARALASVTVIAPTALAADGLATAVFVIGPDAGVRLLEHEGVGGVLIGPDGAVRTTRDLTPPAALTRSTSRKVVP